MKKSILSIILCLSGAIVYSQCEGVEKKTDPFTKNFTSKAKQAVIIYGDNIKAEFIPTYYGGDYHMQIKIVTKNKQFHCANPQSQVTFLFEDQTTVTLNGVSYLDDKIYDNVTSTTVSVLPLDCCNSSQFDRYEKMTNNFLTCFTNKTLIGIRFHCLSFDDVDILNLKENGFKNIVPCLKQ